MKKSKKESPRFLAELESKHPYVKKEYERLAAFIEGKPSGDMHPEDDAPVLEYGMLSTLMSTKQSLLQDNMGLICEDIKKNVCSVGSVIHFERNAHRWGMETASYGRGICELTALCNNTDRPNITDCFDIDVDTRLKLSIYIGAEYAFMKVTSDKGNVYYYELDKFNLLYNEVGEPGYTVPFDEPRNGPATETGMRVIVLFDKSKKLSFTRACLHQPQNMLR